MLKGVGVVCFLSCYSLAFVLEMARFWFLKGNRSVRIASLCAAILGVVAHSVFLYYNDLLQNERFFPSAGGWFYLLAFGLVLAWLWLYAAYPKTQFGLFLFPAAIVLVGVGLNVVDVSLSREATCRFVRLTHVVSMLCASLASIWGAIVGLMFFVQRRRLRRKILSSTLALPTIEWLGSAARFATNGVLLALGFGVASGFYLRIFGASGRAIFVPQFDLLACGAIVLFLFAFVANLSRFRREDVELSARDASLSFFCCAVLVALALFTAFVNGGRWHGVGFNDVELQETSDKSTSPPLEAK